MPVIAYRNEPFKTTHEKCIFDELLSELQRVFGDRDVALLGNFYCSGAEIDAAVVMDDSISVIEFKDYGGKITFSENGNWYADDIRVKGGSKRSPFIQVRDNKYSLLNGLKTLNLPSRRSPELRYISGIVLFHRPITFDDNQVPGKVKPWFNVTDFDHVAERLTQITSDKIDLTPEDIEAVPAHLGLQVYRPVGVKPKVYAPTLSGVEQLAESAEFPAFMLSSRERIEDFLQSEDRILVIGGMIGTGKELLMKYVNRSATSNASNVTLLAPNRRIADTYPLEANSIYSYIFSTTSTVDDGRMVYPPRLNDDPEDQVYVVGDCHLISDSKFETDMLRFGSGHLLSEFLAFVDSPKSSRRVIFIGDPFQITRGKVEETPFSTSRLKAISGFNVVHIDLDGLLSTNEDNPFIKNCLPLASAIQIGAYNRLEISIDESSCKPVSEDKDEKRQVYTSLLKGYPDTCKFIAYSHRMVNVSNDWARKVFNRSGDLEIGDLIHIHNGFFAKSSDKMSPPILVANDSFAEILAVDDEAPIVQELRGREAPIHVHLLKVEARVAGISQPVRFIALRDFLYAEKPELDNDIQLALQVSAETKFRNKHPDLKKGDRAKELAEFLRNDPHFNAAQIRFGYALTLHRAQGRTFQHIIADCDIGQGQSNENYFRWLYTLFTIPQHSIQLANIPNICSLSKAEWKDAQGKVGTVKPSSLIPYDMAANATMPSGTAINIEEPQLIALFVFHSKRPRRNPKYSHRGRFTPIPTGLSDSPCRRRLVRVADDLQWKIPHHWHDSQKVEASGVWRAGGWLDNRGH